MFQELGHRFPVSGLVTAFSLSLAPGPDALSSGSPGYRRAIAPGVPARPVNRNLVHIFVRNLRAKLGDDAQRPDYIFSERGVGYRMPDPGER